MATINIGGRALDVRECTIGFWKRFKKLDEKDPDGIDKIVDLFFELLAGNEGMTREWIEDNLPMRSESLNAKFSELIAAGGLVSTTKEKPAEGEPQAR